MIRLATVFSGIGAIEHALERMDISHEIVFACDNGDVEILSKKIKNEIYEIEKELILLKILIQKIDALETDDIDYKNELNLSLNQYSEQFERAKEKLESLDAFYLKNTIVSVLTKILCMNTIKQARQKEYNEFLNDIISDNNDISRNLKILRHMIEIQGDFTKDNDLLSLEMESSYQYKSKDGIDWQLIITDLRRLFSLIEAIHAKKIIKTTREVCEKASMLHERIKSFYILEKLNVLDSYQLKKEYVDKLYKAKEHQNKVKETYISNYNLDENKFHWNISFLDGKQFKGGVDLFVGGSPCQSFSLVGKQRGLEDTRGTLFYEYARLIKEIRPKVFIYENVKAVLSNDYGKTWETMKKVFSDLDYTWDYALLNAKEYGIPQNRERLFVVGFRKDLELEKPFVFPNPIKLNKTMRDFLLDNVSGKYYLNKKGVDFVTSEKNLNKRYTQIDGDLQLCQKKNQQFNWHGDFIFVDENKDMQKTMEDLEKYFLSEKLKKYVLATGTKGFYSRPQIDLDIARPLLTTMHKMHRAGVDNYVTTEGRIRKLTPRECLRLMGFCDSFKISVSDTSLYQQAGNSIVVDVLMAICREIFKSVPSLI